MGLGRTIQALALVLRDRTRGEKRPVLLVCPTSVVGNWEREAARFPPEHEILVHHGGDPEATERLRSITGPFILRRRNTDPSIISDLPPKLEMKVYCGLTPEQATLFRAVVKETEEGIEGAEGIQRKGLVLATISKLKQVCNHPAQLLGDGSAVAGRSGKLARLAEMLEEALSVRNRP